MVEVKFYDTVNDELLKFAVIISQSNGKWVFCKHKERDTNKTIRGRKGMNPYLCGFLFFSYLWGNLT